MTIAEVKEKCKGLLMRAPKDALVAAILVLASIFSFGLGYLTGRDAGQERGVQMTESPLIDAASDARVVASRSGTRYYHPWCSGADRISGANAVWFDTPQSAEAAGYTRAANCGGN